MLHQVRPLPLPPTSKWPSRKPGVAMVAGQLTQAARQTTDHLSDHLYNGIKGVEPSHYRFQFMFTELIELTYHHGTEETCS